MISQVIYHWKQRHPSADRPTINWDLLLILIPVTLSTSIIGYNFASNYTIPSWIRAFISVILLSILCFKIFQVALQLRII